MITIRSDAKSFHQTPSRPPTVIEPTPVKAKIAKGSPTTPFKEPHHFNLDEFEYERKGSDPGRIIIFNHETFELKGLEKREGTLHDVVGIINCFQRLGFNINPEDVISNGTVQDVIDKLNTVLEDKKQLEETNSLIIFFLTHGYARDELYASNGTLKCTDVWKRFIDCQELNRKPKMFVFQACKGDYSTSIDGKETSNKDPSALVNMDTFQSNHIGRDMLILFSTIEGNESYRNLDSGSWFIQELCKNISMYGRRDDVISIATRILKCICGNYFLKEGDYDLKQMPVLVSTLSRKFYLNRNKDRHLLMEINNKQDILIRNLDEILSKLR